MPHTYVFVTYKLISNWTYQIVLFTLTEKTNLNVILLRNLPAPVYCCKLLKSPRLHSCVCAWFRDEEYKKQLFFVVSNFSCDIPKKNTIIYYRTWLAYLDLHRSCSKFLSSFSWNWNIQISEQTAKHETYQHIVSL